MKLNPLLSINHVDFIIIVREYFHGEPLLVSPVKKEQYQKTTKMEFLIRPREAKKGILA